MPVDVIMPKLGLTMTEGVLTCWLVAEGNSVTKGQDIFELETDKAVTVAHANESGVLHIIVEAGTTVPVLERVGYILLAGEELLAVTKADQAAQPTQAPAQPTQGSVSPVAIPPTEVRASPLAKRIAKEAGIDLTKIPGTGEGGRITQEDVEREIQRLALAQKNTEFTESRTSIPIQGVRAVIARRMLASSQSTAAVTLTCEVDATQLVELRQKLKGRLNEPVSYNDILIKVTALCLREFPYMNARREGEVIQQLAEVHIGLAVDTERGLIVPVIRNADHRTILEIGRELREKTERALAGKNLPNELEDGTFTITNLGSLGVDAFTPVINLPQVAILGMGRIARKPVEHMEGIALRYCMVLSLTFDHCLVDGTPAARFLRRLKEIIETPDFLSLS